MACNIVVLVIEAVAVVVACVAAAAAAAVHYECTTTFHAFGMSIFQFSLSADFFVKALVKVLISSLKACPADKPK